MSITIKKLVIIISVLLTTVLFYQVASAETGSVSSQAAQGQATADQLEAMKSSSTVYENIRRLDYQIQTLQQQLEASKQQKNTLKVGALSRSIQDAKDSQQKLWSTDMYQAELGLSQALKDQSRKQGEANYQIWANGQQQLQQAVTQADKNKIQKDTEQKLASQKQSQVQERQAAVSGSNDVNSGKSDGGNWITKMIADIFNWWLWLLTVIFGIIRFFLSLLLTIAGLMFDLFFTLEQGWPASGANVAVPGLGYITSPIVVSMWTIARDLANMFFAIVLLVIAFSTILLGMDSNYGIKKLLPRLIIIALLINFSLMISGIIVDASQVFLHYFVDQMKSTDGQDAGGQLVSWRIMSYLNGLDMQFTNAMSQQLADKITSGDLWGAASQAIRSQFTGTLVIIASGFMSIWFLLTAIFAFLTGVALLVMRMLWIWGLLIVSPLAWLSMALPPQFNSFQTWFKKFTEQCLVGPVYVFFIWVAMEYIKLGGLGKVGEKAALIASQGGGTSFLIAPALVIFSYIILIGILMAGFIVAPKLGGESANAVINMANKYKSQATGWAKRKAGDAGRAVAGNVARSEGYQKAITKVASLPGGRFLARPMQEGQARAVSAKKAAIEKKRGDLERAGHRGDQLANIGRGALDNETRAAVALQAAKQGDLGALGNLDGYKAALKQTGHYDDFIKAAPHLDDPAKFKDTIKNLDADGWKKVGKESINNADFQRELAGAINRGEVDHRALSQNQHAREFVKNDFGKKDASGNAIAGEINAAGRANLFRGDVRTAFGLGQPKEEILGREVAKEMNNPVVRNEANQRFNQQRTDESENTIASRGGASWLNTQVDDHLNARGTTSPAPLPPAPPSFRPALVSHADYESQKQAYASGQQAHANYQQQRQSAEQEVRQKIRHDLDIDSHARDNGTTIANDTDRQAYIRNQIATRSPAGSPPPNPADIQREMNDISNQQQTKQKLAINEDIERRIEQAKKRQLETASSPQAGTAAFEYQRAQAINV